MKLQLALWYSWSMGDGCTNAGTQKHDGHIGRSGAQNLRPQQSVTSRTVKMWGMEATSCGALTIATPVSHAARMLA